MDTLIQSQTTGAGTGAFLAVAVWAAAIVAAVIATVQRAQGTREILERMGEVERSIKALSEPARPAVAPSRTSAKFGAALYQESPSPIAGLLSWPGAALTLVAALLGLAGGGLLLVSARGGSEMGARYQQQLGQLRVSQDSLLLLVQGLRDSARIASERANTSPASTRAATAPAAKPAPLATASREAPSRKSAVLPKAPALDPGAIGASPKAPDAAIPKAPVAP